MVDFKREFAPNLKQSCFLFGPRMTGKTSLLRNLSSGAYYDLLDVELELALRERPKTFWEEISSLPSRSLIIVDEVQRITQLLDYVQKGIEEKKHIFILSGSSARKLKRGGANLLGGRALDSRLHPLTRFEIGDKFKIEQALSFGTLPKISSLLVENDEGTARGLLRSYVSTYIKEEIQSEALTRNIGAFQRFLGIAAQSHAQVIEYQNISASCSVPASTVKEYYSILEDTLLGSFLWPWDRSERKKARPKFYFFDCGVVRAMQNRLVDPPTSAELGFLFEGWFVNELVRIRDYLEKEHEFSFWREGKDEVDLLITRGGKPAMAFEIKSGKIEYSKPGFDRFEKHFGIRPTIVSLTDQKEKLLADKTKVLPWAEVISAYRNTR